MQFEFNFLMFLRENISNPILDKIMIFITSLGNGGLFWIVLAFIMLIFKKTRKTGVFMLIALALGYIMGNLLIKNIFARARPYLAYSQPIIIPPPSEYSFPSGHTLSSFSAALCILSYKKHFGVLAIILATLIAFSRMYLFVHYPTDIIGGILLSLFVVFLSKILLNKIYSHKEIKKTWQKV